MNYPRLLLATVAALVVFFAWGFFTEGWMIRKDFAASAALYRTSDLQMKYMAALRAQGPELAAPRLGGLRVGSTTSD